MDKKIKIQLVLLAILTLAAVGLVSAYVIQFNTVHFRVNAAITGTIALDKTSGNVGDTVTITAQLSQPLSGIPIQFTKNGVSMGSPVTTNTVGVATYTYIVLTADSNTDIAFSATANSP